MDEMEQIKKEFLVESAEMLDGLDQELVRLEREPQNSEIVNSIFRKVHTIKGTCGFLEFSKLESVTHVGETLLDGVRSGEIPCNQEITSALLALFDATRKILSRIESCGNEGDEDYSALIDRLRFLIDTKGGGDVIELVNVVSEVETHTEPDTNNDVERMEDSVEQIEAALKSASPAITESVASPEESAKGVVSDTTLRVDVGLLDQLMNLVGELVLTRNQILQFTKHLNDSAVLGASQRLNLIVSELQEGVMKTRMQPIANIWNKFPRVVRDVAKSCGKQVRLEMEGKETDLDKTIIEAIKDPLTHIIRNSVDHGIEAPEVRRSRGKALEGVVRLRAFHEGGHVIIEISDDGGGLNTEKIRQKALERGLVSAAQLGKMSETDIHRLIFAPGFSTADKITTISGRGVGMDVVRSNIEAIGGQVDVMSREGEGSIVKIKIPLTLAIIPAIIVSDSGERFAIPQVNIVELVRVQGSAMRTQIEEICGSLFYRLRGNLLPLISLREQLQLQTGDLRDGGEESKINIIVVRADEMLFGLMVETVHDTEEIVVKPLGKHLKEISSFAGATIMGDGKVALILDVLGIAKRAELFGIGREKTQEAQAQQSVEDVQTGEKVPLLVVQATHNMRAGIRLDLVHRLEEFPLSKLESAGGHPVVQYRGGILPLVDLTDFFESSSDQSTDTRQVVVFSHGGKTIGFLVDRIVDIVEESLAVSPDHRRQGTVGSAIVQKKVTELLDVGEIIRVSRPEFVPSTQQNEIH